MRRIFPKILGALKWEQAGKFFPDSTVNLCHLAPQYLAAAHSTLSIIFASMVRSVTSNILDYLSGLSRIHHQRHAFAWKTEWLHNHILERRWGRLSKKTHCGLFVAAPAEIVQVLDLPLPYPLGNIERLISIPSVQ